MTPDRLTPEERAAVLGPYFSTQAITALLRAFDRLAPKPAAKTEQQVAEEAAQRVVDRLGLPANTGGEMLRILNDEGLGYIGKPEPPTPDPEDQWVPDPRHQWPAPVPLAPTAPDWPSHPVPRKRYRDVAFHAHQSGRFGVTGVAQDEAATYIVWLGLTLTPPVIPR